MLSCTILGNEPDSYAPIVYFEWTVASVQVIATYYNTNNVPLENNFTYTNPNTIEPGQSASYTINVGREVSNDIDHIKYHIDRQWQYSHFKYVPITVKKEYSIDYI